MLRILVMITFSSDRNFEKFCFDADWMSDRKNNERIRKVSFRLKKNNTHKIEIVKEKNKVIK